MNNCLWHSPFCKISERIRHDCKRRITVVTSVNTEDDKGGNNAPNIKNGALCAKLVVFFGLVGAVSLFL